ncbi:unnamed protein product [Rotaria sp. Silwood2]|nr:unnamed protein product [Rotaria sp. Silwood2]
MYRCHRSLIDSLESDNIISSNIDDVLNNGDDSFVNIDFSNQSDFSEDSESFIYQDEDLDETNHLLLNFDPISCSVTDKELDFDKLAEFYTRFLLELREYHLLPQKVVQSISSYICTLFDMILKLIKTKLSSSLISITDLETAFTHVNRLISSISKNEYVFLKQCQKYFNYESPIEIVLNKAEDRAYYIPLKASLSHLLYSGELLNAITDNIQSLATQLDKDNDLILSNRQSRSVKSNISNNKKSNPLLLKLYTDGIGITNPIGPKKDAHKFTCFYFLLDDLPDIVRSQVNLIGLHCMTYTKHLQDKESRDTLMNVLVEDLNHLQTEGITIPCISSRIYFMFSSLSADNLASNELGGFQKNFNSGSFCRHCFITYERRHIPLTDISFVPRTRLKHDLIVNRVITNDDGQALYGVTGYSWFRNLLGFHPTESLPPDLMHDTAEGSTV